MQLSKQAIDDLRLQMKTSYGEELASSFSDEELNTIGDLLLTILAEGIKLKLNEADSNKKGDIP